MKNRYEEIVREIEKGEIVVKKEEEERKMADTFYLGPVLYYRGLIVVLYQALLFDVSMLSDVFSLYGLY